MEQKLNRIFDTLETSYFYTIGFVIAICVAWGIYDAVKVAIISAPWFWVLLGIGTLYIIFVGFIIHILNTYLPRKKK